MRGDKMKYSAVMIPIMLHCVLDSYSDAMFSIFLASV